MAEEKKATKTTKTSEKESSKSNKPLIIGIVAVAVVAAATFIILGVCGVFGGKNLTGKYELVDIVSDGESQTSSMELLKAFGMSAEMELRSDKTGTMSMYGEDTDVKWDDKTITSDGESAEYSFKDNKLTIKSKDGSEMVFEKKN